MELKNILDTLYLKHELDSAPVRREYLNTSMKALNAQGKDCSNCSGICCTYAHNSMLITPLEAVEMLTYIMRKNRLTPDLIEDLKASISEYRLDKDMNLGVGREFRRNYTCPFFNNGVFGCSISPKHKPYGCLGFNSKIAGVKEAGNCMVYQDVHDERERKYKKAEDEINQELKEKFNLYWDKKNIPSALVELINSIKQY